MRESDPGKEAEIIVADGDLREARSHAVSDGSVRRIISARGRAVQMNRGAEAASGEVLLFLHADTLLPPHALVADTRAMKDRRIVAGAFDLGFDTKRKIFRVTEKYVYLRTRLTKIPFGDQAIFIRRDYFGTLGGYREIPIMEDVDLMKRIRKRGDRVLYHPRKSINLPAPVRAGRGPLLYVQELGAAGAVCHGCIPGTSRKTVSIPLAACSIKSENYARGS